MPDQCVKITEVVSAVYSLDRPTGVTRRQIIKFCRKQYGTTCPPRAFAEALDLAVEEHLLSCFQQRYRPARLTNNPILWGKNTNKNTARKNPKRKSVVKKSSSRKIKANKDKLFRSKSKSKNTAKFQRAKRTSFLYKVWCKLYKIKVMAKVRQRRHETRPARRVKYPRALSNRNERNCKGRRKIRLKKVQMKYNLRSKRAHRKIHSDHHSDRRSSRRKTTRRQRSARPGRAKLNKSCSLKSSERSKRSSNRDFYKKLMQQTKQSVLHAKSWDQLNHRLHKKQKENAKLVQDSRLVQKILTRSHGGSWDNLNDKLRQIKAAQTAAEEDELNRGDPGCSTCQMGRSSHRGRVSGRHSCW